LLSSANPAFLAPRPLCVRPQVLIRSCVPDLGFLSNLRVVRGLGSHAGTVLSIDGGQVTGDTSKALRDLRLNSLTLVGGWRVMAGRSCMFGSPLPSLPTPAPTSRTRA